MIAIPNKFHLIACLCIVFVWGSTANIFAQNNYWQQNVDTRIEVTLDDVNHFLNGNIEMDYYNNSPDTLHCIYFHLYPNAYKNDRTAFARQMVENGDTKHYYSKEEERGYIDSLQFYVNDTRCFLKSTSDIDVTQLVLKEPLLPGEKIKIYTPFSVKIPITFSRLGHNGQSYQISQWFPKPAVYDKNGWNAFPYLGLGEFYSEFGSYEVSITLPENYIVLATGNIQEQSEIAWLDSLSQKPIDKNYKQDTVIPSSEKLKTITFKEDNVHDFAWFADKSWAVRKKEISVPGSNNIVTAYSAFYPNHSSAWERSVDDLEIAVQTYSELVGAYPYKTVKVVEGALSAGGGMEYPTITIVDYLNDRTLVNTVIVHEIGHNWFYGILGTNERKYPWMDEAINSYYEKIAVEKFREKSNLKTNDNSFNPEDIAYKMIAAKRHLQPLNLSSEKYTETNYGVDIYYKGAKYFKWLAAYMGIEEFNTAMQEYFATWQFKHPQPEDFRAIMEKHTYGDLTWFFDEVLNSSEPIDFAIKSVKKENNNLLVKVKNKTSLNIPVLVTAKKSDSLSSSTKTITSKPFKGFKTITIEDFADYKQVFINNSVPDFNITNNTNGRRFGWKPFVGLGLNEDNKIMNWVAPAIGYNYYDGIMLGLFLHNITIPENRFTYALAPLYGLGSKELGGTGFISYISYPKSENVHSIEWKLEGKKFSNKTSELNISNKIAVGYTKIAPEAIIAFRNKEFRSPITRSLSIKGYWINEMPMRFIQDAVDSLYRPHKGTNQSELYARVQYKHNHTRTFNPFSYVIEGQAGEDFAKLSATFNLRVDYNEPNKALHIRTYGGKFFNFNTNNTNTYRYFLSTTHTGENDYLYDETYIGRLQNSGFLSQQTAIREGGFISRTSMYANRIGMSDNWLLSLNVKTDIPYIKLPIPVRIFANVATFSNAGNLNPSGASILFESGIETTILRYLTVSVPVFVSKDFSDYNQSIYSKNKFLQTISFSLQLSDINWRRDVINF